MFKGVYYDGILVNIRWLRTLNTAKFGLSEGKSGGETLAPYHYYSSGSSTTRTLKYSKKAK